MSRDHFIARAAIRLPIPLPPPPSPSMRIGILGTGVVGTTIGMGLVKLGHEVKLGSRTATNEKAAKWVDDAGTGASQGTFADAAAFGEMVFNCTSGEAWLAALGEA